MNKQPPGITYWASVHHKKADLEKPRSFCIKSHYRAQTENTQALLLFTIQTLHHLHAPFSLRYFSLLVNMNLIKNCIFNLPCLTLARSWMQLSSVI